MSSRAETALARVRRICLALPGATEKPSHGAPAFFTKKGQFVALANNHHGDDRLALWCSAPPGAQSMLVDSNPDAYFVPPYVGHRGWVGVLLDRKLPWPEIEAVIEQAYRIRSCQRRVASGAATAPHSCATHCPSATPLNRIVSVVERSIVTLMA